MQLPLPFATLRSKAKVTIADAIFGTNAYVSDDAFVKLIHVFPFLINVWLCPR